MKKTVLSVLKKAMMVALLLTGGGIFSNVYGQQQIPMHIIDPNTSLTVQNVLNMIGWHSITIQSGGELIIDGGAVTNAHIQLNSGGKLTIKNGGKLVMSSLFEFSAPVGAVVDIINGEILSANDF